MCILKNKIIIGWKNKIPTLITPLKNGWVMHVVPKPYIKCPSSTYLKYNVFNFQRFNLMYWFDNYISIMNVIVFINFVHNILLEFDIWYITNKKHKCLNIFSQKKFWILKYDLKSFLFLKLCI
jgi:hypothetical protein